MDKQEKSLLIARAAQEPEDRLLLARVLDKQEQMERRNIPASTGFLSPREQMMAVSLLNAAGIQDIALPDTGGKPSQCRRYPGGLYPGWRL